MLFKDNCKHGPYLEILDTRNAIMFCKIKISNHRLALERANWQNIYGFNRKCLICDTNDIGKMDSIIFDTVDTLHKAIGTSLHAISDKDKYSSI